MRDVCCGFCHLEKAVNLSKGRPNNAEIREAENSRQRLAARYVNSHAGAEFPSDGHGQQCAADESRDAAW